MIKRNYKIYLTYERKNKHNTKELDEYHFIKDDSYICDSVVCKTTNITERFLIYPNHVIFKKLMLY